MGPTVTRRLLLAGALAVVGASTCTSTDPPKSPAPSEPSEPPQPTAMNLGLMYWAPHEYVLGGSSGLVFGAEVETIESRAAERPQLRGATIVEATLKVDRVLRQIDPPSADRPARRLRPDDRVHTDGGDGLAVGDRVLVFASTYDGGYGIVPKRGTRTPVGIVVRTWSDPIVGAVRRWLDDESSWSADVEIWRPYGEGAIACMRQPIPMSHCDR